MLLILTNSTDVTADYLVGSLSAHSISFARLDTDTALESAQFSFSDDVPCLTLRGVRYLPTNTSNIWYRRPERLKSDRLGQSPEAEYLLDEWSEAIDGYLAHIPFEKWMNHPIANVRASSKIEQLTTARRIGFHTPATLVTQEPAAVRAFFSTHKGRIIAKPLSMGYIERSAEQQDSLIYTSAVDSDHLVDLTDLQSCPTFFQQRVEKEFDVRITIVDDEINAMALFVKDSDGSQRCDVRRNNMEDVAYQTARLPAHVVQSIRSLMKHYRLRYGAIDMAVDRDGRWVFFEINPNGQWAWLDLAGGANIADLFLKSFSSAQK